MTKRQLIDEIVAANNTAEPAFLAMFDDQELSEYLEHLRVLRQPRLSGDPHRYERYFRNCPTISSGQSPLRVHISEEDAADEGILPQERQALSADMPGEEEIRIEADSEISPLFDDEPVSDEIAALGADELLEELHLRQVEADMPVEADPAPVADVYDDSPEQLAQPSEPAEALTTQKTPFASEVEESDSWLF